MKSTTKLGDLLFKHGFVSKPFTANDLRKRAQPKNVSDETYGDKSFVYVNSGSLPGRAEMERILTRAGFKVIEDYSPASTCSEIQVSYFKGWHWDE
mgnify:CR=1 FL=1|tara:strand:+ start:9863 stop:10150 length:288 start_codon:yes stop_codon:yes gene_type:complete